MSKPIQFHIENQFYINKKYIIKGWVFSNENAQIKIKNYDFDILRYPRIDVADHFQAKEKNYGFEVEVPFSYFRWNAYFSFFDEKNKIEHTIYFLPLFLLFLKKKIKNKISFLFRG